jgi:hypothetical protein
MHSHFEAHAPLGFEFMCYIVCAVSIYVGVGYAWGNGSPDGSRADEILLYTRRTTSEKEIDEVKSIPFELNHGH